MPNPPFRWTTRIRFIDTDASGRIHYTALFRYFESTELEFFRAIGVLHDHPGIALPRVHVECDYRTAIRFDDLIEIEVSLGRLGNTSMQLRFRVMKEGSEAAAGNVVIAAMDRETQRATPIPPLVREKLQPWLTP